VADTYVKGRLVLTFEGYNKLGNEITRFKTDWREQIDISTPHRVRKPSDPLYHNLLAPNQWPDPNALPRFRPVYEEYIQRMGEVSMFFTSWSLKLSVYRPTLSIASSTRHNSIK
jgi:isopenicillin N synthase-like dioxygenase